jgi:methionine sulfoxide reductase heme-binding subunit
MPTMGTASVATGVISMLLVTAVVALGITVNRHGRLPGMPRFAALRLHRYLSLLACAFIAAHVLTAVLASNARIGLAAGVVPSASWIGLGAVSFDLLIALVTTSLLRRHLGRRTWRAVHWLAYACWPAALAHTIGIGPRLHQGLLFDLAVACVAAVVAAGCWRLAGVLGDARSRRRSRPGEDREPWPGDWLPQDRWQSADDRQRTAAHPAER